jgi:ribonuclease III
MIQLEREKLLSELEQKIGYSFRSRALLDRALTHRSFANERVGEKCPHNEAMEFLGDSVLGFVVSAWLLERFPELAEGKLSKMKAYLVSESRLVELAEALDLGSYILLNRGEEKTGGRQKRALLADAYEALIGVLYVDGGIAVAERFLRRELRQKLVSLNPASMIGADYKSALQERLQASGGPGPEYVVVEVMGPDHRRNFRVELRIAGRAISTGEGHTIKIAQQEAARVALESPDDLLSSEQRGEQKSQQKGEQGEEKRRSVAIGSDYEATTAALVEAFGSEPSRDTSARTLEVYADEDLAESELEV